MAGHPAGGPRIITAVPLSRADCARLAPSARCRKQRQGPGKIIREPRRKGRFRLVHLLLAVPYVAVLWVPFYNRLSPTLAGIPFFYWYQMAWIAIGAAVLLPVYLVEERDDETDAP